MESRACPVKIAVILSVCPALLYRVRARENFHTQTIYTLTQILEHTTGYLNPLATRHGLSHTHATVEKEYRPKLGDISKTDQQAVKIFGI